VASIRVLPDALVNQIAAGEVVERPASVVKELVENALDAEALRVIVDVEGGGVSRIEVADDGCGMGPEDAVLALRRHATSKIATPDDLARIGTLGFRGEALPSIASVSRLTLTTSPDGSGLGTEVVGRGAAPPAARPVRQPRGTRVVVENLFGDVPARRKFLKSADAELRAVVRGLTSLALARPGVAFTLRSGKRLLLELPAVSDAAARLRDVLGGAFEGALVPVSFVHRGMSLSGAVTPPETTFPSRTWQWLFVNGRAVKDATASHAARLAGEEALRTGRHPAFALFVACSPGECDVNVHPQKLEVRFRDPSAVHALVHRGLQSALGGAKGATEVEAGALSGRPWALRRVEPFRRPAGSMAETIEAWGEAAAPLPVAVTSPSAYAAPAATDSPVGALRLLGQYDDSFLVAEGERGLVLVDQHVAHERVRYERILERLESSSVPSQSLLLPVTFEPTAEEAVFLSGADGLLASAGFVISERAGRSFVVSAAPADTPPGAVVPFLREFLSRLAELPEEGEAGLAKRREALAASLACRGAVTVHTRLAPAEASKLLSDLARCRDPWTCPHGRPILLTLDHAELLKRFGRRP
jgi:DNA mismatch repair protein MutL